MTHALQERPTTVRTSADAIRALDDAAYFRWCRLESDKYFMSLIRKRFPQLG